MEMWVTVNKYLTDSHVIITLFSSQKSLCIHMGLTYYVDPLCHVESPDVLALPLIGVKHPSKFNSNTSWQRLCRPILYCTCPIVK